MNITKCFIPVFLLICILTFNSQLYALDDVKLTVEEKAWISKKIPIRARVGEAPPLHFYEEEYLGMSVDYLNLIGEALELKIQYVTNITWPDALNYIANHEVIDVILTAKITSERKKKMLFTKEYLLMPYVIFSRMDTHSISGIEDLTDKAVSIEAGYALQHLLTNNHPGIRLVTRKTTKEALQSLSMGEVDAYVGNLTIGSYLIQRYNFSNIKIVAPTPFGNHNQAMAVRDDWPELVSIIDKALAAMSRQEHELIKDKWLSVRYEYGIQLKDVLKWILVVIFIAVTILIFFLMWNRRLKKEVLERKIIETALKDREKQLHQTNQELNSEITNHKRSQEIIQESEKKYRQMFESNTAMKLLIDPEDGDIVNANPAAVEFYGYKPEALYQLKMMDINILPAEIVKKHMRDASLEKQQHFEFQHRLASGEIRDVEVYSGPMSDNGKNLLFSIIHDITDRKRAEELINTSLKEKETLLQEIHHRVKNNLNVISSLLQLQANSIGDDRLKNTLHECQNRVYAMSAVHETLHGSEHLSDIDLKNYLTTISSSIFQSYSTHPNNIHLNIDIEASRISINQAYPIGLVINELITNALKYAFPAGDSGEITIRVIKLDQVFRLMVMDNGIGMPPELDWKNADSLGLKLVRKLVENQLDGSIDMNADNGTQFTIEFKIDT